MDRSYYTSFEIKYAAGDQSVLHPLMQHLKLPVNAFAVLPAYRQVNLVNDNDELIAPIELLCLDTSLIVTVHPSAAEDVKEQLLRFMPAESV